MEDLCYECPKISTCTPEEKRICLESKRRLLKKWYSKDRKYIFLR